MAIKVLAGHEPWTRSLTIPQAGKVAVKVALRELVDVTIDSDPSGATVAIDGVLRGRTPLTLALPAGRPHAVRLQKQDYAPLAETLSPAPAKKESVSYTLEPDPEAFGTRDEWFAVRCGLAPGMGGTDELLAGALALDISCGTAGVAMQSPRPMQPPGPLAKHAEDRQEKGRFMPVLGVLGVLGERSGIYANSVNQACGRICREALEGTPAVGLLSVRVGWTSSY